MAMKRGRPWLLLGVLAWGPLLAEPGAVVERLQATERQAVARAVASQGKIDALDAESQRLEADYRRLRRRLDRLRARRRRLEHQLRQQGKELTALRQRMERIPDAEAVEQLPRRMVAALEAFIRADLPFHIEERLAVVSKLREMLGLWGGGAGLRHEPQWH